MMNNRIRELAERATDKWVGGEFFDREKFAELIVRECADLIDNKRMITAPETYDDIAWTEYDTKEQCAKKIREHFGVKE